jgi:hypothetical protein
LQFAATSCKSPTSERREPSCVRHASVHMLPERDTKRDRLPFFGRSSWRECRSTSRTRDRTSGDHTAEVAAASLWSTSQEGPRILRGAAFRARCDMLLHDHRFTFRHAEGPQDRSILRERSFRARASKRVGHGEGPQRQENNTEDGKHSDVREHRAEWYAVDGDLSHRS